ncbi:MAG TPA: hypothetical protein VIL18_10750 [Longimicrobiales bacterium]
MTGLERARGEGEVRLLSYATSPGGGESPIEHRTPIEGPATTPENLLRLSIGLGILHDRIADLEQAPDGGACSTCSGSPHT